MGEKLIVNLWRLFNVVLKLSIIVAVFVMVFVVAFTYAFVTSLFTDTSSSKSTYVPGTGFGYNNSSFTNWWLWRRGWPSLWE